MTCNCNQPKTDGPQRKGVVKFCDICDPCNEAKSNVRLCAFVVPTLEEGRYYRNSFIFVEEDDSVYYISDDRSEIPFGSRPKFIENFDPTDAAIHYKSTVVYDVKNHAGYVYDPEGNMVTIALTAAPFSSLTAGEGILVTADGGNYTVAIDPTAVASTDDLQNVTLLVTNHTGQISALQDAQDTMAGDIETIEDDLAHVHDLVDDANELAVEAKENAAAAQQTANDALSVVATKQDALTAGDNITIVNNTISATDTTYSRATTTANGLMSDEDRKQMVAGLYSPVEATADTTSAGITFSKKVSAIDGSGYTVTSEDITIPAATTTAAGMMSSADKTKLDGIDMSTKQDILTAGTNIQIANNTISATDTTYSDFTGTDGTTAGTAGLVPAPATTDVGKFLKADGTWDTAGSAINVVQSTGTSTTDVMSQNATTSMVFASGYDPTTSPNDVRLLLGKGYVNGANSFLVGTSTATRAFDSDNINILGGYCIGTGSITIGSRAGTSVGDSQNTVIGYFAETPGHTANGVAIGAGAQTTYSGEMNIGTSRLGNFGFNNSPYRLLTGLYDGQNDHDAATYGQVISYSAINGAGAPTTATEGKYVGQLYYDTTNEAMYFLKTIDTTTTPATYTWEALGGGSSVNVVQTTGTSTTDVMSQNAVTSMVFADPGTNSKIRIGSGGASFGSGSIVIGDLGSTFEVGNETVAIGHLANSYRNENVIIGHQSGSNNDNTVVIGHSAKTQTVNAGFSVAIGAGAKASMRGQFDISTGTDYPTSGYNGSNYRLLTGLYDPQSAHDAATKGYADSLVSTATFTTNEWNALWA